MKFECQNCGKCCQTFRSTDHVNFHGPDFYGSNYLLLNEQFFMLFDWEAEQFQKKLSEKQSPVRVVPTKVMFDLKNNQTIAVHYSVAEGECPLHSDKGCEIYADRPLICREFPCFHNIRPLINGNAKEFKFSRNNACIAEREDTFYILVKNKQVKLESLLEMRYGATYDTHLMLAIYSSLKQKILDGLEKEGKIQLAKKGYDVKHLLKRIELAPMVNFTDFCKKMISRDIKEAIDLPAMKARLRQLYG